MVPPSPAVYSVVGPAAQTPSRSLAFSVTIDAFHGGPGARVTSLLPSAAIVVVSACANIVVPSASCSSTVSASGPRASAGSRTMTLEGSAKSLPPSPSTSAGSSAVRVVPATLALSRSRAIGAAGCAGTCTSRYVSRSQPAAAQRTKQTR